jgi:hypothetical protein
MLWMPDETLNSMSVIMNYLLQHPPLLPETQHNLMAVDL